MATCYRKVRFFYGEPKNLEEDGNSNLTSGFQIGIVAPDDWKGRQNVQENENGRSPRCEIQTH